MMRMFTLMLLVLTGAINLSAQDGFNQLIVVNGGQFGDPSEQTNIGSFNPTTMDYVVFDTLPVNSVQHVVIEGDYAYVAAQGLIAKYDLDSYERVAMIDFPGLSAHQIAISEDYVWATNFYGQTEDNLYVLDKNNLTVVDTISEILAPEGTMVIFEGSLFIGQNVKGSIDACPPFGCLNDTLGYIAEVDIETHQFVQNHNLNNNGAETGRLVANDFTIFTLNSGSNTITSFNPTNGQSTIDTLTDNIQISKYRNETAVINQQVVSKFNDGIGVLSADLESVEMVVDTPVTAFAYDILNDDFYLTSTDFFSYSDIYSFNGDGTFQYELPAGFAPEAISIHYNNNPIGANFTTESADTVLIAIADIATDIDGDSIYGESLADAPVNGVVTFQEDGTIMYRSFSVGSSDFFRVKVCDDKLNPLCTFVNVTISGVSSTLDSKFDQVNIYPNPVTDLLNIENEVSGSTYIIYDALGQQLITSNSNLINVKLIPSGSYFLKMNVGVESKTLPFIKF